MKLELFKPEDFRYEYTREGSKVNTVRSPFDSANYANQKLNEYIESLPKVFGQLPHSEHVWNTKNPEWHDTHQAYLICIEPIEKKECEHEPLAIKIYDECGSSSALRMFGFKYECKHCGKKLKAHFEVDE